METNRERQTFLKNERALWVSFVFWFFGCFVLIALDQWVKFLVFYESAGEFLEKFRPLIGRQLFYNDKFAFSLPVPVPVIYFLYGIITVSIIVYLVRHFMQMSGIHKFAWMLIVAGAVSNIGERVYYGNVKDFLYIATGIFNVADLYIILGIIILLLIYKHIQTT